MCEVDTCDLSEKENCLVGENLDLCRVTRLVLKTRVKERGDRKDASSNNGRWIDSRLLILCV